MSGPIVKSTPAVVHGQKTPDRWPALLLWCLDHWIFMAALVLGTLNLLPFLAPVFMHLGWTLPARLIYTLYSTLCHQMAQRSFFLFSAQPMHNLADLPVVLTGSKLADMEVLRAFTGNAVMGWKVAWSDRMVYMFGAMWIAGMLYRLLRRQGVVKPLSVGGFIVLLIPMLFDGGTHLISDMGSGLTGDFRYANRWLAELTGHDLPAWFYVGDAFGSFNSWMRLISGVMFGIGAVWLTFPYLDNALAVLAEELRSKMDHSIEPNGPERNR